MPLLQIVLVLIVVGVVLWLVSIAPFINATIKQIIFWLVIVCVVVWLLNVFGLLDLLSSVRTPHVRH